MQQRLQEHYPIDFGGGVNPHVPCDQHRSRPRDARDRALNPPGASRTISVWVPAGGMHVVRARKEWVMASTSRERVYQALQFEGPDRAPRNLWSLPWAELHFPEALKKIRNDFPDDFAGAPAIAGKPPEPSGTSIRLGAIRTRGVAYS